jgi:ABC-type lipoprotein export system ATPase subunit
MHILAGLDSPTSGKVWVGDEEITNMDDDELTLLRRRSIGFIFQFLILVQAVARSRPVAHPPPEVPSFTAEPAQGARLSTHRRPDHN